MVICWEIKEGFSVSEIFDALLLHQLFRFIPSLTKASLDPAEPRTGEIFLRQFLRRCCQVLLS